MTTTTPLQRGLGALALLALSAAMIPASERLGEMLLGLADFSNENSGLPRDCVFCALALALCLLTPRRCGLTATPDERLRTHARPVAVVFLLPPLLVLTVYATMTDRPFHGSPWSLWLIQSIAQEFFFTGFVYARCSALFGEPGPERRDALHPALLFTALCFTAWHWPNIRYLSRDYLIFQGAYTFLGACWLLQMRRWTGSLWPGVANHVLVNWLASVV